MYYLFLQHRTQKVHKHFNRKKKIMCFSGEMSAGFAAVGLFAAWWVYSKTSNSELAGGIFFFFISRPVRVRITVYQSDELDFVILVFFRINIEFYGLTGNY